MRVYYRSDRLCGKKNGNGKRIPFLKGVLYSLADEPDLQPFSMADIQSVLFNKHHSIGCSIKAPFKTVSWQSQSQWYEVEKGHKAFLPQCICFTDGLMSYSIVVIGDQYELRAWRDSHRFDRTLDMWFSHEPIVYDKKLNPLKESFAVLLEHIQRQDALATKQSPQL
uniref:hypothetical protein n=1 Tax=Thaumasiovibrio occultus TaxID=1891184 RepID=UPI000B350451|nr:hypothetical protein [Thaumasiovibrio occultus]